MRISILTLIKQSFFFYSALVVSACEQHKKIIKVKRWVVNMSSDARRRWKLNEKNWIPRFRENVKIQNSGRDFFIFTLTEIGRTWHVYHYKRYTSMQKWNLRIYKHQITILINTWAFQKKIHCLFDSLLSCFFYTRIF